MAHLGGTKIPFAMADMALAWLLTQPGWHRTVIGPPTKGYKRSVPCGHNINRTGRRFSVFGLDAALGGLISTTSRSLVSSMAGMAVDTAGGCFAFPRVFDRLAWCCGREGL